MSTETKLHTPTNPQRWRCRGCHWSGTQDELLSAPSPFDPAETLVGCPQCRLAEDFEHLCDEPGCMLPASCGWPVGDSGYRHTCYKHSQQKTVGNIF